MSYPRSIRTLIIEDETQMVDTYARYFEEFCKAGDVCEPRFARSYTEGARELSDRNIYHLVILDLGLPQKVGDPAPEGEVTGTDFVSLLASRDDCPVPVALVVSGRLGQTRLIEDSEELAKDFYYFKTIQKAQLRPSDIENAIEKARRYGSFGIHTKHDPKQMFQALSPREDDLLRRSGLRDPTAAGLDLTYWNTAKNDFGGDNPDWSKVMMGRIVLGSEKGYSHPKFYKMESTQNFANSKQSAELLSLKLQHIKVESIEGRKRSLLVTDKVGGSFDDPISLQSLLGSDMSDNTALKVIASDIVSQCKRLGRTMSRESLIGKLFWSNPGVDRVVSLESVESKFNTLSKYKPSDVYKEVLSSSTAIWHKEIEVRHGDLHMENVALDRDNGVYRAFIFDGGATARSASGADVAYLEVSLLLHQRTGSGPSLVEACAPVFGLGEVVPAESMTTRHKNTRELIACLRREALADEFQDINAYYLLLLDAALVQLQGYHFEQTGNRIVNMADAFRLVDYATDLLKSELQY